MKTTSKRTQALLLGTAVFFGSQAMQPLAQSQGNTTTLKPQPIPASKPPVITAETEQAKEGTTNIIQKLADLPILKTNDPFANTFAMLKRAATDNPIATTLSNLSGNSGLQLRGSVVDSNNQRLALVEVGRTGVHVVREGDTLSLAGGGRSANVTILQINKQSVEVEFGNFEDSVIIR